MQGGNAPLTLPPQRGLPSPSSCPQHTLQTPMGMLLLESPGNKNPHSPPTHLELLPGLPGQLLPHQASLPWCSLMQNSSPDYSQILEDMEVRQAVWPR